MADAATFVCPGCGATSSRLWMSDCQDLLCGCPGAWDLRECAACRLISMVPPPTATEIMRFYPASYLPYNPAAPLRATGLGNVMRRIAMAPYALRFGDPDFTLRPPSGGGRLLDIGCGAGRLLKRASGLGWSCWGLDVSADAVAEARRHVPTAVIRQGTLEEFDTDERFDMITMSHVLEHVPDPVATLKRCRELLAPNGRLLIGIPNIDSWEARLFGRYWTGLDIPRHLVHFREDVLRRMLADLGFTVTVRPAMFASSISESLIRMFGGSARERFAASRAARVLYLLTVLPAATWCLLGNRGMIEVVAVEARQ
jgi:2-polyprenyl-3-methyl-5-hydroxy-6-metoxy-1,4-benzoquinol methylase